MRGLLLGRVLLGAEEAARLPAPVAGIEPLRRQQLGMAALFDDAAAVEHDDAVHLGDGRQPVRDGKHGLALHHPGQRLLDLRLDLAVERRGRLVQHQDRRVLEEGAGERDALPLPAREPHAAFAKRRVIAAVALEIDEATDELVGLGRLRGGDHLGLGRVGAAVEDVLARRAVEHRGLLRDHADLPAQGFLRHRAQVVAVDAHRALLGVVKPQQQRDEGRFPRPRGADDADPLARADGQGDVIEPARLPAIGEGDVVEGDLAAHAVQRERAGGVGQLMCRGQGAHAVLDLADIAPHRHQRLRHPARHLRDADGDGAGRGDVAGRRGALLPHQDRAADEQNGQQPREGDLRQPIPGAGDSEIAGPVAEGLHRAKRGAVLVLGMGEQLHRLDVGDGVDDLPGDHRPRRGPRLRPAAHMRQEAADQRQIGDQPDGQRQRPPDVDARQQHHRTDDRGKGEEHRADHLGDGVGDGAGGLHLLLRDAAGKIVVEEGDGLAHRPAVQPRQHERHHVRPDQHVRRPGGEPEGGRPDHQVEQRKGQQQRPVVLEVARPRGAGGTVDDQAQQPGGGNLHRAGGGREEARDPDRGPGPAQAPAEEGAKALRRWPLGGAKCVDHRKPFLPAEYRGGAAGGKGSVQKGGAVEGKARGDPARLELLQTGAKRRALKCGHQVGGLHREALRGAEFDPVAAGFRGRHAGQCGLDQHRIQPVARAQPIAQNRRPRARQRALAQPLEPPRLGFRQPQPLGRIGAAQHRQPADRVGGQPGLEVNKRRKGGRIGAGQHMRQDAGRGHRGDGGGRVGGAQKLAHLVADPLAREPLDPLGKHGAGGQPLGVKALIGRAIPGGEAEEAQDAQEILADALRGFADEAQPARRQIGQPLTQRVEHGAIGAGVERVHREVAPRRVFLDPGREGDGGVAAEGLDIAAEGGDLVRLVIGDHRDRAMLDPGRHGTQSGRLGQRHDLLGPRIGGNVDVRDRSAKGGIAHAATDQEGQMPARLEHR
ncbi:hypothetical protein SDC9_06410 [bioreactor metagenome]|uniref:Uncharacterized protein n=1 Tax=bioreactor metagenome TaxID=1076179 RepID=A0A644T1R5_9ZZZZ